MEHEKLQKKKMNSEKNLEFVLKWKFWHFVMKYVLHFLLDTTYKILQVKADTKYCYIFQYLQATEERYQMIIFFFWIKLLRGIENIFWLSNEFIQICFKAIDVFVDVNNYSTCGCFEQQRSIIFEPIEICWTLFNHFSTRSYIQ